MPSPLCLPAWCDEAYLRRTLGLPVSQAAQAKARRRAWLRLQTRLQASHPPPFASPPAPKMPLKSKRDT